MADRKSFTPLSSSVVKTRTMLEKNISLPELDRMLKSIEVLPKLSDFLKKCIDRYNAGILGQKNEDDLYMTTEKLALEACISRAKMYDAIKGKYIPEKDALLRIALALKTPAEDAQQLLKAAHRAQLSASDPRDLVIICCLSNNLTLDEADGLLMERDMKPLTPEQKKLSDVLTPLMGDLTLAQLLAKAGLDPKALSFSAQSTPDTLPFSRSDLLRIGFALHLPSTRVQSLLRAIGCACLSHKKEQDKQLINALDEGRELDEIAALL